jgi:hypothetical protein
MRVHGLGTSIKTNSGFIQQWRCMKDGALNAGLIEDKKVNYVKWLFLVFKSPKQINFSSVLTKMFRSASIRIYGAVCNMVNNGVSLLM